MPPSTQNGEVVPVQLAQHLRWKNAKDALWNGPRKPMEQKPTRREVVSPFVRAKREAEAARIQRQREHFERQVASFRAGFIDSAMNAPAQDWPAYTPPVTYDHFTPPTAIAGRKTMREIIKETAIKHHVSVNEILSPRRDRMIVAARQESMWRCKMETTNSLPQIGKAHGGRDHTTAIHAIRQHEKRRAQMVNEPLMADAEARIPDQGGTR